MKERREPAGFSLVELLVCTLFLALFTVAMQQFSRAVLRGVRVLEVASEAQEAARLGVQLIVADLREAGYSATGGLGNGLRRAEPNAVALVRDLSGDGDTDDANEQVGYTYDANRRSLMRGFGDAPPQPLITDIAGDGVRFRYLNGDGALLAGDGPLDEATRARVRRITVHVAVEIPHPDPAYTQPIRIEQDGVASLRNG